MTTSVLQFIIQNTTVTKVLGEGMKTITEASKLNSLKCSNHTENW